MRGESMKLSEVSVDTLLAMPLEAKWRFVCEGVCDDGEVADVAILLGSNPARAIERAEAAAALYHTGRVKYVVPSGGVQWEHLGEQISEANLMKRVMLEKGVPEEAILLENEARTTIENMICSTFVINRALRVKKTDSVILVTSHYHMKRSLALAHAFLPRKFKISCYPSFPKESREEWLASEKNRELLDNGITLMKRMVDTRVIEDFDVDV